MLEIFKTIDFLRDSGVLFHIDRSMKGRVFCPVFAFQKDHINFISPFLILR